MRGLSAVLPGTLVLVTLLAGTAGSALAQAKRVDAVEVELVAERLAVVPGQTLRIGLRIKHDEHWHTYWRNPGDSGLPTQPGLVLPAGVSAADPVWPAPQRIVVGPLANFGYEGEIVLPMALTVDSTFQGSELVLAAKPQWLMCKDVCIPGEASLTLKLPVQKEAAGVSKWGALFARMDERIPNEVVQARGEVTAGKLLLALPGASIERAEFFPYAEGWLDNPAAQSLYRIREAGTATHRLELPMVQGTDAAALEKAAVFGKAAGVAWINGKPVEVRVVRGAVGSVAGELVATAGGVRGTMQAASSGGSLLGQSTTGAATGGASRAAPGSLPAVAPGSPGSTAGTKSLVMIILLAAVGGLILNLMPCVFPVVGLKVLSFAGQSGADSRIARNNALAFCAGVLVSFWVLGVLLLGVRAAGEAVGWGFQLQMPWFVALMALLFVAIGLNLSGVYEIGTRLTQLGSVDSRLVQKGKPIGSFASGALAVLVATPCTAPFMGSALGFTLGQSSVEAMLIFTGIGLGMALPYALLGLSPGALRWLPKPGRWMQTLREWLAFPMYATAAWLAWVLGQQVGIDAVFALAIGAVLLAMAAWLLGRFVQQPSRAGAWIWGLMVVCAAGGVWIAWPPSAAGTNQVAGTSGSSAPSAAMVPALPAGWSTWSEDAVGQALARGQTVFVDFTAAWCVSCQANKKLVLERDGVRTAFAENKVALFRADWTHRDPLITAALARHGRNGVPLYVVYRPGEREPSILPELLTTSVVVSAIRRGP